MLADQAAQHLLHIDHQRVQVEDLGLQHLAAAEGQQLAGQRRRLLRRSINLLHLAAQLLFKLLPFQHHAGIALDDGQHIVEVVGNSAGERADGFHPLGDAKLLFQALALADVDGHGHDVLRLAL